MKNKSSKQKSKRRGGEHVFGCDLTQHLQGSGEDVPQVLKVCAEFIEEHGVVDGIYRLSGITSNIQRLRQEFSADVCPDLTKEVYLQDIHCVGSLCKLYFRELPTPLLTYQLYKRFTEAVSAKEEHEQLRNIQHAVKELPECHFRTLEYLSKHLARLATLSPQTNMHARNLALVWAPNLLRSQEMETSSCNGDSAFLEVRIQQTVVEFILNHTEQIFNHAGMETPRPREGPALACGEKYATLPVAAPCGPMKLMTLEEAQARSLSPNHPARRERQRENSLPDTSTATLYHTVIDLDSKRKFSGKSKKWKSIFSLGRSVTDSKGKLSRNGSVFMRAANISDKPVIRPSKSMDSLCSLPADEDKADKFSPAGVGANGFFAPAAKSRTLGSDFSYDPSDPDPKWEFDLRRAGGASRGSPGTKRHGISNVSPSSSSASSSSSSALQKVLPEQLKVFKGDDLGGCQPTSPKNRRMLYSGSAHNGSSTRPSFPGNLFPLELSPRHQRKALNISEPFAVSVPLRVSAVISSNSTPCRPVGRERPAAGPPKGRRDAGPPEAQRGASGSINAGFREGAPCSSGGSSVSSVASSGLRDKEQGLGGSTGSIGYREYPLSDSSGGSGYSIYSNSSSILPEKEDSQNVKWSIGEGASSRTTETPCPAAVCGGVHGAAEPPSSLSLNEPAQDGGDAAPPHGRQRGPEPAQSYKTKNLSKLELETISRDLWSDVHQVLRITEAETNLMEDTLRPCGSLTKISGDNWELKHGAHSKRRSSLPAQPLSSRGHSIDLTRGLTVNHPAAAGHNVALKQSPVKQLPRDDGWDFSHCRDFQKDARCLDTGESLDIMATRLGLPPLFDLRETDILQDAEPWSQTPEPTTETGSISDQKHEATKGASSGDTGGDICHTSGDTNDTRSNISDTSGNVKASDNVSMSDKVTVEKKLLTKQKSHGKEITGANTKECDTAKFTLPQRLDEKRLTLELPQHDDDDSWCGISVGLDQVEPWEDLNTTKLWVTSPLHSPKLEDLFPKPQDSTSDHLKKNQVTAVENINQSPKGNMPVTQDPEHGNICPLPQVNKVGTGEHSPANTTPCLQDKKVQTSESRLANISLSSQNVKVLSDFDQMSANNPQTKDKTIEATETGLPKITEQFFVSSLQGTNQQIETKGENLQFGSLNTSAVQEETIRLMKKNTVAPKQRNSASSQRLHRQVSHELRLEERNEENIITKHRPYSLNLDLGHRCIRDISNQQNLEPTDGSASQRGVAISGAGDLHSGLSLELEMFLSDRQAPMRRNSAPVSVSSIRTAFMVKTRQAKAVPVIPPQLQYSHIPHPVPDSNPIQGNGSRPEKETAKIKLEKTDSVTPLQSVRDTKEGRENREPVPRQLRHTMSDKQPDPCKPTPSPEPPVLRRKRSANGDSFMDCPRPDRSTLLQRSSFRNRQRPQSLILFSPPFPIMDYPPVGDDGKLVLSPIKSPTETSPLDVFSKELADNLKTPEGVTMRNKMTIPKSGQRLETSTSCFYQPQRRSMIFDSRSNRQIE